METPGGVYISDPRDPYSPLKREYHLESDASRPPDAERVSIPAGASAFLVTLADGDMLMLAQKDRLEIHTVDNRPFQRLPWLAELQFRFNHWWETK